MRRLAERPANVLFLAGSVIRESPLGFLWPGGRRDNGGGGNNAGGGGRGGEGGGGGGSEPVKRGP